jgi:hypothetical protein
LDFLSNRRFSPSSQRTFGKKNTPDYADSKLDNYDSTQGHYSPNVYKTLKPRSFKNDNNETKTLRKTYKTRSLERTETNEMKTVKVCFCFQLFYYYQDFENAIADNETKREEAFQEKDYSSAHLYLENVDRLKKELQNAKLNEIETKHKKNLEEIEVLYVCTSYYMF